MAAPVRPYPVKKTSAASLVAARRHELPNGLVVILRPNRSTRSIALRLMIRAGGAFDPPGASGTAHFAARLLDRGAGGLSGARLAEDFDALGIGFDARARLDSLDLTVRALSRHLPLQNRVRNRHLRRDSWSQDWLAWIFPMAPLPPNRLSSGSKTSRP